MIKANEGSWDSTNNRWADELGQPDWKLLPNLHETLLALRIWPHIGRIPFPHIVLPNRRTGPGSPLLFEFISPSTNAAASKVEFGRAQIDGSLEQLPVHPHVNIRGVELTKSTRAGDLGPSGMMHQQRTGYWTTI